MAHDPMLYARLDSLERGLSRMNEKIDALAASVGKSINLIPEHYEVSEIKEEQKDSMESPMPQLG